MRHHYTPTVSGAFARDRRGVHRLRRRRGNVILEDEDDDEGREGRRGRGTQSAYQLSEILEVRSRPKRQILEIVRVNILLKLKLRILISI